VEWVAGICVSRAVIRTAMRGVSSLLENMFSSDHCLYRSQHLSPQNRNRNGNQNQNQKSAIRHTQVKAPLPSSFTSGRLVFLSKFLTLCSI
jgi:hypothetical protein